MKKEWADKWVAALRSGDYAQGQGSLKQLNLSEPDAVPSFCCLGVLCDIAKDAPEVQGEWDSKFFLTKDSRFSIGRSRATSLLPPAVMKATGMQSDWGQFEEGGVIKHLTVLNDKYGLTFEEIADIIDRHWEQL